MVIFTGIPFNEHIILDVPELLYYSTNYVKINVQKRRPYKSVTVYLRYMKRILSYTSTLLLLPFFAYAQSLQGVFKNILTFINSALIPFIIGIAFLFFVINTIRYFVIGAANEDSREKAKALAIYGVMAFVFITVFWGIVNLFSSSIGLEGKTAPESDYVKMNKN